MVLIKKICRIHCDVAQEWLSKISPPPSSDDDLDDAIEIGQSFEGKPLFIYKDTYEEYYWLAFLE